MMERLPMCRICLAENVRMYIVVNRKLHELYEKLTDIPFVTEDYRPIIACVFCCAKLKQCYRLLRQCVEAEKLFNQMVNEDHKLNPLINQARLDFCSGLITSPIFHISIDDEYGTGNIKEELPAVSDGLDDDIEPMEEYQSDGDEEIWIPPHVPVLKTQIKPGYNLSDSSSVYEVGVPMSLSKSEALLAGATICVAQPVSEASDDDGNDSVVLLDNTKDHPDNQVFIFKPAEESSVGLITDVQDLDEATANIMKRNTAGSYVTDELLPKVSSNDHETTRPKTTKRVLKKSFDVSYNEQSEGDGDFSPRDGSDYVSDCGDKSQYARKNSIPCTRVIVPETPDASFEEITLSKSASQRSWNRRNCCPYCENLVTNFTRHLMRNHGDKIEVLKLMAINDPDPKIQKTKRQAFTDNLRNRGNYIHNSNVVSNNKGYLIPTRRKANEELGQSPSGFVICRKCLGTYRRSTFYRHSKKCIGNEYDMTKHALARHALSIIPKFVHTSKEFQQNILPRLRNDEISHIVKQDPLIIAYGCRLLKKNKEKRSQILICSKMRDLANLLKIVREKNPDISQLQNLIDPKYYECFIEAVKVMSRFNEETGDFKMVSIPARIRPGILGCIDILFTNTIMDQHKSTALKEHFKNKLTEFKLLLEANWKRVFFSNSEKTRTRNIMRKEQVMPLEKDVEEVMIKIHDLEEKYYDDLKKDITNVDYEKLCETKKNMISEQKRAPKQVQSSDTESSIDIALKHTKYSKQKNVILTNEFDDGFDEEIAVPKPIRRKKTHNKWSSGEVEAVMRHLKQFIKMKKNPGKSLCEQVLRKEPILHKRTWMQINTYINNIYKKNS